MRILITGSRSWPCHALAHSILLGHCIGDHTPEDVAMGADPTGDQGLPEDKLFEPAPREEIVVVHGACPTGLQSVDWSFDRVARGLGLKVERHPAQRHPTEDFGPWPGAGPRRNWFMIRLGADVCLAVHDDIAHSKGTLHCARSAIASGIPTFLFDGQTPGHRVTLADLTF